MTSSPSLSILIATIGRRNDRFLSLCDSLAPQLVEKPVEVIAYWNNGELSIGDIRQKLLEEATGEYVCFIDDDDRVPSYYCEAILQALGKDYVGFELELFNEEKKMPRVYHSIKYGVWHQDEHGYYRGVTHLNPIKREIALRGRFGRQGSGEDETWARMVTPLIRTENYIDRIMYYYHHDRADTCFGGSQEIKGNYQRPVLKYGGFRYHADSKEVS